MIDGELKRDFKQACLWIGAILGAFILVHLQFQ